MITLPWRFGNTIRDSIDAYRKKYNIPEPKEVKELGVYRKRDTFFEDEMQYVQDLSIDKTVMDYIHYFPNVINVTIQGNSELDGPDFIKIIHTFPNIQRLTIKGQNHLQFLDIHHLKSLKKLELISNRNLHQLIGIDMLSDLEEFTFYDNVIYAREKELCDHISSLSEKGVHCNIDVLYMPLLQQIGFHDSPSFHWCESIGLGLHSDEITYSTSQLEKALEIAKKVVDYYIHDGDSALEKYAIIYQWVCENIQYDYNSLNHNHYHVEDNQKVGSLGGANGTVNGLIYGSCVCEGYTKIMQLLLKLCNIPSFDIGCIIQNNQILFPSIDINGIKKTHSGNHSILKVNIDGSCYYSDVTWDASRFQKKSNRKYFLLSTQDIKRDHVLLDANSNFASSSSISQEKFQELMNFAEERIRNAKIFFTEKDKSLPELISEVDQKLSLLRKKHNDIAVKVEGIMMNHSNYSDSSLSKYIVQRDSIQANIDKLISLREKYTARISKQKMEEHKKTIEDVEKLLGITISPFEYIYDHNLNLPNYVLKDSSALRKEQGIISKQLEFLYQNNKINGEDYRRMTVELYKEYHSMVRNAPKPDVSDNEFFSTEKDYSNIAPTK